MNAEWGPQSAGQPLARPNRSFWSHNTGCANAFLVLLIIGATWAGVLILGAGETDQFYLGFALVLPALLIVGNTVIKATSRGGRTRSPKQVDVERRVTRSKDPYGTTLEVIAHSTAFGSGTLLGATADSGHWVVSDKNKAVLVLGPPQSGKTTGVIIPAAVTTLGPLVSTATKGDVFAATAAIRARLGRVWYFDPAGSHAVPAGAHQLRWSPVDAAGTWDEAQRAASALVGGSAAGQAGGDAIHWLETARQLLGPLLFAAAAGGHSMNSVRRWVKTSAFEEPLNILQGLVHAGRHRSLDAQLAHDDLLRILGTEERERSGILSTLSTVISVYSMRAALESAEQTNFDPEAFCQSSDTIYICASATYQQQAAPVIVALLSTIKDAQYRRARSLGAHSVRSKPAMVWLLDEAANICPLRDLPSIVSEGGGQGLQLVACFQDLSQARRIWKEAADGFTTLFDTKVVFPGIGDVPTLESLSALIGDWDRPYHTTGVVDGFTHTSRRRGQPNEQYTSNLSYQRERLVTPAEIARTPVGTALVVRPDWWGLVQPLDSRRELWKRIAQQMAAQSPHPRHAPPDGPPVRVDHDQAAGDTKEWVA